MTYCAGWKYQDAVFLLADSAVTKSGAPSTTHTSLGQLHASVGGYQVEEALLKLVPLGGGVVAAFAGDVLLATSCLNFLRDNQPTADDVEALLQAMTVSMGPFGPDAATELLIAASHADGRTILLHWSTASGINQSGADFYQIGSLTSYHAALTPAALQRLASGNLDPGRMLPVAAAVVQSYGIHDDMISMNVGGLVFGIQTRRGTISWHQDVNILLYDPSLERQAFISAIARDNSVAVCSSITDDTRVFGHTTSVSAADLWTPEWLEQIKAELDGGSVQLWVFICTVQRVITLLFRPDINAESRYIKFSRCGAGRFDIGFSSELLEILLKPLNELNDGSLPWRLNVMSDLA